MMEDVYDDDGLDDIHHYGQHDDDYNCYYYYYYYNDGLKVLDVNRIIIHYNDDVDVHDVYDGHDVKNYLFDVIQILMIYPKRNVMLILYLIIIIIIISISTTRNFFFFKKRERKKRFERQNIYKKTKCNKLQNY